MMFTRQIIIVCPSRLPAVSTKSVSLCPRYVVQASSAILEQAKGLFPPLNDVLDMLSTYVDGSRWVAD